ncbi:MAG TPA: nucleotide synthetase [Allosphingosinicella sp.]
MATMTTSPYKLKDGEPTGFAKKVSVELQLQYRIDDGDYVWSYRSIVRDASSKFLAGSAEFSEWSKFMAQDVFETSLDIGIDGGDTLIQVDTVGADLFWSLHKDAVMTLDDHSPTYGELRYWNGSRWLKRENFDQPSCQRIRFKALHHAKGVPGTGHKFSYNVRLRNAAGVMVEHEIDPDLQNPKT